MSAPPGPPGAGWIDVTTHGDDPTRRRFIRADGTSPRTAADKLHEFARPAILAEVGQLVDAMGRVRATFDIAADLAAEDRFFAAVGAGDAALDAAVTGAVVAELRGELPEYVPVHTSTASRPVVRRLIEWDT